MKTNFSLYLSTHWYTVAYSYILCYMIVGDFKYLRVQDMSWYIRVAMIIFPLQHPCSISWSPSKTERKLLYKNVVMYLHKLLYKFIRSCIDIYG